MKTFITLRILTGMLAIASSALSRTLTVNCDTGGAIGQVLKRARPRDTIRVTGTCDETVTITTDRLTLDGQGKTVIDGGGGSEPVVTIEGVQGVTIRNLTVRNGFIGIAARRGAAVTLEGVTAKDNADAGIEIADNSTARLTDCTAENNGEDGIQANRTSSLTFLGNLISTGNQDDGLAINHGSSAFFDGTVASLNNNGARGISIFNGSAISTREATIAANQNGLVTGGGGVEVNTNAGFRIGTNTTVEAIGNKGNGIVAFRTSTVGISSGSSVRVEQNGSRGMQATETSTIAVITATVVIESNAQGGVQALRNSFVRMQGTGLSAQILANTGNGVEVNQDSSVRFDSGTVIRNNTSH